MTDQPRTVQDWTFEILRVHSAANESRIRDALPDIFAATVRGEKEYRIKAAGLIINGMVMDLPREEFVIDLTDSRLIAQLAIAAMKGKP